MTVLTHAIAPHNSLLSNNQIRETMINGLRGQFTNAKLLVLIPDHTRTLPLPLLFRYLVEILSDTRQLDFMVALGTHPPLDEPAVNRLVGITYTERTTTFRHIGILNHEWDNPESLSHIGTITLDQIKTIAGNLWHPSLGGDVPIRINRHALSYDAILIVGPTFPHEVVGFSGGAKYLFPGISGPELINVTHWLGALMTIMNTIGIEETPMRQMIHDAASCVTVPVTLLSMVVERNGLAGIFIGDMYTAWHSAVQLSSQRHITWVNKPFQRVLSCAPAMYDELWTGAKAMYKLEPVIADGGEIIVYAPHLKTVSHVHGKYLYETGYHIRDYFLAHWESFNRVPLGVLAHSTHLRGTGIFTNGIEQPRIHVTLASQISAEDCQQLNLGYLNPANIDINTWKNSTDDTLLYVPKAGEMLYRLG